MPFYSFAEPSDFRLPLGCRLVGVEITEDAVELPRFRHPARAAYVFGAERFSLSPQMLKACEFVVKIPTRFSINVGMAGAIVLYDRLLQWGAIRRGRSRRAAGPAFRPFTNGARRWPGQERSEKISGWPSASQSGPPAC